jgi:Type I phosphodiesterase / nucleotide pyrophosphatase
VSPRRAAAMVTALGLVLVAGPGPSVGQEAPQELVQRACALPHRFLVRAWNGYRSDRAGDILLFPKPPAFIGHGGLPHSGAWDYINEVPMFWYGPGHIAARGEVSRPVTSADIAPTQAELLDFGFDAPDGRPMGEALAPGGTEPPRLIVLLVWDGAGDVVLDQWPDDWPRMRALVPEGTWYENATVGSSPPSTAQIHASMGTGAFPRTHGLIAHHFRLGREIVSPWEPGPNLLLVPSLADVYDRAEGNRPEVGVVATVAIHLGMVGHGAMWGGGDRDLVVLRERPGAATLGAEGLEWRLSPNVSPWFRFPRYVNDLPPLSTYLDEVDLIDGTRDGDWRGHDLDSEELLGGFHTPARIPYQTRLMEEVVRREGFGADPVPDLLYVNYKLTDEIGHRYTMNSIEMRDSLRAQDEALASFTRFLDREVGPGEWVVAVTADHGHTPDPAVTGNFMISPADIGAAVDAAFDGDEDDVRVIDLVQPAEVFINHAELAEHGHTLEEVAELVMTLTKADTAPEGVTVPAAEAGDPVMSAAFPSSLLEDLPCLESVRG